MSSSRWLKGVKIRILSNLFEATDAVAAVQALYAQRRKPLLEGGSKLYELRRLAPEVEARRRGGSRSGSSASSLRSQSKKR